MISIDLGKIEYYDDKTNQFEYEEIGVVRFEYSLKALYEWEGKWKKPFLKGELTEEETIDFFMTMALDPMEERFLTSDVAQKLSDYIADQSTATVFRTNKIDDNRQNGYNNVKKAKVTTAEEVYATMFAAGVPLEFENRNLNRLMTILRVIGNNNNPPKKMSREDTLKQNAALNAQRRAKLKTKG